MSARSPLGREAGMVLLVCLLALLVLALFASTVSRGNRLQLQMAGNAVAKTAAMQRALAAIDAVVADPANFPAEAAVGYRNCRVGATAPGCDEHTLVLPAVLGGAATELAVEVERLEPLLAALPVAGETRASSAVHYRVARFEVSASLIGQGAAQGTTSLTQGVLLRTRSED